MTPKISFEVFPPKTPDGLIALGNTAARLAKINPAFISVTYGAGGSDRTRSFDAIKATVASGVAVAGHLTCVGQSIADLDGVLAEYKSLGVNQVVALRGDPAEGVDAPYVAPIDGYQRTADLVAAAKAVGGFEVSVSAYPEKHPQSPTEAHDLDVLAEKVDAGADRAMTQMFFDNQLFLTYREHVRNRGIDIPIVPGIFPIHSFSAVSRFAARCGASMPAHLAARFADVSDPAATHELAADIAAEQITELANEGVEHFHLYTINRPELALDVCSRLGITPTSPSAGKAPS